MGSSSHGGRAPSGRVAELALDPLGHPRYHQVVVYTYAFVAFGIVWLGLGTIGFGIYKYLRHKAEADRDGTGWKEGL